MFKKKYIIIISIIAFLGYCIGSTKVEETKEQHKTDIYVEDFTLGNGNYIAGTDFTEGTYTISAINGNGNVYSSNLLDGGINALIGVGGDETLSNTFQKEYKNISLPKNVKFTIKNVTVNMKYIRK